MSVMRIEGSSSRYTAKESIKVLGFPESGVAHAPDFVAEASIGMRHPALVLVEAVGRSSRVEAMARTAASGGRRL
jgi:hypothetical protein